MYLSANPSGLRCRKSRKLRFFFSHWKRRSVGVPSRDVPSLSLSLFQTKSPSNSHGDVVWRWDVMVTSHDVVTSWRDVRWPVLSWQNVQRLTHQKLWKITFFNLVTLTFDLWPWPSNSSEILPRSITKPNFATVCQTVQPWEHSQTHRQTGPIPYPRPLTREGTMDTSVYYSNLFYVQDN